MAHPSDIEQFAQLAAELPLAVVWRTALAQTWARTLGARPRPAPAPPDGSPWKRRSELEPGTAPAPEGDPRLP